MPSNMPEFDCNLEPVEERDLLEREERCQKAIKVVTRAIVMRLLICGILLWVVVRMDLSLWAVGLMLLVLLISLTGLLPLISEWKKRRREWKQLLEEEEF